ncbi:flagellar biosynthetic protein FliR [Roseivivax isoporae]|uniref:Flagellar biosynthesis protein FliR n=1 Tax=Roseivivax isoporae LMG 25204 TaxID=1449351 RepID=X7FA55_9RHOB|nr:flagellar biosynthetic protein FliR [Roseivivax isoporae]ETX29685.1 flagellar biosynthesis protein FliR [Roseivivax isoporae LMG 25204]
MTALAELSGLAGDWLWGSFAVFLRAAGAFALMPAFGEQVVPARIRLGLALAVTAICAPAVLATLDLPAPDLALLVRLVLAETLSGLLIGAVLRLFVMALQIAGSIAAQATSLAQLLGGAAGEPLPTLGHVLTISALALLTLAGFHVQIAEALVLSYGVLPFGAFPGGAEVSPWGVAAVAQAFALGFTLAAPFLLVSTLYNLTLGVINKAMPQLMVAFVGAPLITFGAVAILMLCTPLMLSVWHAAILSALARPFGAP